MTPSPKDRIAELEVQNKALALEVMGLRDSLIGIEEYWNGADGSAVDAADEMRYRAQQTLGTPPSHLAQQVEEKIRADERGKLKPWLEDLHLCGEILHVGGVPMCRHTHPNNFDEKGNIKNIRNNREGGGR
jgi:hypothetical protein